MYRNAFVKADNIELVYCCICLYILYTTYSCKQRHISVFNFSISFTILCEQTIWNLTYFRICATYY